MIRTTLTLGLLLAVAGIATAQDGDRVDFETQVRPILSGRCVMCHGATRERGGLRLDDREAALTGGAKGPVIVPGRSEDSRLFRLVSGAETKRMPPGGDPLTPEQVTRLRDWIDQGAGWPESRPRVEGEEGGGHWAWRPRVRPPEPPRRSRWIRNEIDGFVKARLDAEGLKPTRRAGRETWLRRVSLDLTGLPPTIAEMDAWLADRSIDAQQRVIDRLLASPHYGEKWAARWLDLARYADTNGYEKDSRREVWPWRDWVIDALNADMPFDRFTVEQLAGDLLPDATPGQRIATGFLRQSMTNEEGGVDPEEYRVEVVADRMETVSTMWLGSTVACARCHDHKFDPFSQEEYYRLFAFFNSCDEPTLEVASESATRRRREGEAATAKHEARAAARLDELARAARATEWRALAPLDLHAAGGASLDTLADRSVLASGPNPPRETITAVFRLEPGSRVSGVRLEALIDDRLPHGSSGRADNGNFVLTGLDLRVASLAEPRELRPLRVRAARADYVQSGHEVESVVGLAGDGPGWSVDAWRPERRASRALAVELAEPLVAEVPLLLTLVLSHDSRWERHTIGRFRISVTAEDAPLAEAPRPDDVRDALAATARGPGDIGRLIAYFAPLDAALGRIEEAIATLRDAAPKQPTTLVVAERATPRETRVLAGGNFLSPGALVAPGVPSILPPLPAGAPSNRLGLARWLASPENPLTARVLVNRVWEEYFGRGLVETSEDFGTQGTPPTHPALLDWLASELVESGWRLKSLHRLIVSSATYGQSSRLREELAERDPQNRWLARGPRFRVPAETVRDIALTASGLLAHRVGGPSVFPPQPDGVWTNIYSGDQWEASIGEDRYRRGIYTFWKRTAPHPMMTTFDAPARQVCCTRRPRTNTPLQALTTLNDPAFLELARGLAQHLIAAPSDDDGLVEGFRRCVGRRPGPRELARLRHLLDDERRHFGADQDAAGELAGAAAGAPASDAAAWTLVASVLLNLDETLTKE